MNKYLKYIISAAIIVAFAFYIIFANQSSTPAAVTPSGVADNTPSSTPTPTPTPSGSPTPGPTPTPTPTTPSPAPTPTPTPNPTPTPAPTGQYKDGTYNGSVADAFYGNLQVAAVISGGELTDVKFLQFPNDQQESMQVNGRSSPLLRQEALAAQSANVNIVSGATQSSEAFQQSLGVALAAAKA